MKTKPELKCIVTFGINEKIRKFAKAELMLVSA